MKRTFALAGLSAALLGGVTAAAAANPHPSIHDVSAAYDLKFVSKFNGHACGSGNDTYETFTGTWKGPQIDTSTGPHARSLTGTVTETSTTTVNTHTGQGIVTGTTQLVSGATLVYKGDFVMNVQLLPDGSSVERGGVDVPFTKSSGSGAALLIGNREATVAPIGGTGGTSLEVKGQMGGTGPDESTAGETDIPDLTAEWNGFICH